MRFVASFNFVVVMLMLAVLCTPSAHSLCKLERKRADAKLVPEKMRMANRQSDRQRCATFRAPSVARVSESFSEVLLLLFLLSLSLSLALFTGSTLSSIVWSTGHD